MNACANNFNKPIRGVTGAQLAVIREFQDFSATDLNMIAQPLQLQHFLAGEEIIRYLDHSDSVFFVLEGSVRVHYFGYSGDEVILCDLPQGEIFGELTAIDGQPRSAAVVARSDSLLAVMSNQAFQQLICESPVFCMAIMQRLAGQIRRLTERVFDFSTLAVRNRIHAELLRLARQNMDSPNTAIINPAPTHAELACFVSTHREAVTRELSELARIGLIQRTGHELRVLDIERLRKMVDTARGSIGD
ncbi:Crp/Fnr family transcriptional regulator [uncultured Nitrosomonas sp.]|uniref:Crp/Fnr family transcriptional regulator n=1 Tax=uncultured Nitrosomonas sp. TaxID=156424 RepID=UPI00262F533F|nr:Crp/Fnr family transcriptional regulator [uncultured Nitrosomonas sp.]